MSRPMVAVRKKSIVQPSSSSSSSCSPSSSAPPASSASSPSLDEDSAAVSWVTLPFEPPPLLLGGLAVVEAALSPTKLFPVQSVLHKGHFFDFCTRKKFWVHMSCRRHWQLRFGHRCPYRVISTSLAMSTPKRLTTVIISLQA